MYYRKNLNCDREHSDFYTNTPLVNCVRSGTPRTIHLRFDQQFDWSSATIEFYNYNSPIALNSSKTITSRAPEGFYPAHDPAQDVMVSDVVMVPCGAVKFRVRTCCQTTNFVPINNQETYFVSQNHIFRLVE